jgi:hypothetical protein
MRTLTALASCVRTRHRTKDVQTLLAEKKNLDSTVGAFVIFNNRKSQQRCLDEYAGSSTWFGRLSQKRQLRFRGTTPISVTEAPEPADIRWYVRNRKHNCWCYALNTHP